LTHPQECCRELSLSKIRLNGFCGASDDHDRDKLEGQALISTLEGESELRFRLLAASSATGLEDEALRLVGSVRNEGSNGESATIHKRQTYIARFS